jgi:putative hemolysin
MIYLYFGGCVFFILLQAFFAASEISFISSSLLKLRHRQRNGDAGAARAYSLLRNPEKFLATTLVGINVSLVVSTSLLTFFFIQQGNARSTIWITLVFTPLVVIFAELIPKNIGRYYRETFTTRVVGMVMVFERLFRPLVFGIEKTSKWLVHLFLGHVKERSPFVTKEEIRALIREIEREGGIDRGEQQAIEEVFDFREAKIKDVSVPLKRVVGVEYGVPYAQVLSAIQKSGFTRYPVFAAKGEHAPLPSTIASGKYKEIIGYVNIYDLFYTPDVDWHTLIRPITKVGINQNLSSVLTTLRAKKETIALVLKGKKIYGIVTVQDIIREIIVSLVKM